MDLPFRPPERRVAAPARVTAPAPVTAPLEDVRERPWLLGVDPVGVPGEAPSGHHRTDEGGVARGSFEVAAPDRPPCRVRPKPVSVLDVMAPSHGQVCVSGLARFFPAHTVHTDRATAVVDGDDCHLRQVDHYHVNRVEISLDQVTATRAAQEALRNLLAGPDDARRIRSFQRALSEVVGAPERRGPTEASVPVRSNRLVTTADSAVVVRADGSRTTVNNRYVVDCTTLPAAEFLIRDASMVRQFAYAVLESPPGERTATFLQGVLRAGRRVDELALLEHASDLPRQRTSLFGLFGAARVGDAATVMVGTGNTHEVATRVDRSSPGDRGILADLADLRLFTVPAVARSALLPPSTPTSVEPEQAPIPRRGGIPPSLVPLRDHTRTAPNIPKRPEPPEPPKLPKRRYPEIDLPGRDGPFMDF